MANIKQYNNIIIECLADNKTEIRNKPIKKAIEINPFTFQKTSLKIP
jgi:hypothetical protein